MNGCGVVDASFVVVGKVEVRDRSRRNYSGDFTRDAVGICGSDEIAVLGDTGNNWYSSVSGVGVAISLSEMTPFA